MTAIDPENDPHYTMVRVDSLKPGDVVLAVPTMFGFENGDPVFATIVSVRQQDQDTLIVEVAGMPDAECDYDDTCWKYTGV